MLNLAWFNLVKVSRFTNKQFTEEMCEYDTNV